MNHRMLSDGIAVYVYRTTPKGGMEFLQLLRSASTGEYQQSWNDWYEPLPMIS